MPTKLPLSLEKLQQLREQHDTPFQLYDEGLIRDRVNNLNSCFRKYFPEFVNYFAVKALPNPAILKIIDTLGGGFDCSSLNEIEVVSNLGVHGSKIMYTSNFTSRKDLKYACSRKVIVNLDDISLLDSLNEVPELISFRLNPGIGRTDSATASNVLGGPSAKFGVARSDIVSAYKKAKNLGSKRFGIHMMTGSCVTNSDYWKETVSILLETILEVNKEIGVQFEFVNIGGGLGIPYLLEQEVADLRTVVSTIFDVFQDFFEKNGDKISRPKLMMENGRYVTGPFGWLVSTCQAIKNNEYGTYYGLDACMANLMRPGMYNSYHHITVAGKSDLDSSESDHRANVVGTLCENNDWFAKDRPLPRCNIGDLFVIHDTGAHAHSMGFNYNAKLRAPELLIRCSGNIDEIRKRESYDSLFGNTSIPEDLAIIESSDKSLAKKAFRAMDLTSLGLDDTPDKISQLCEKAKQSFGCVAAICVYPKFVKQVKSYLQEKSLGSVKVATVVNFPSGDATVEDVVEETRKAVGYGADEVDMVLNYKEICRVFEGECSYEERSNVSQSTTNFVKAVKESCGDSKLKVIIESGYLEANLPMKTANQAIIFSCEAALEGGADFLKTSTGKVPVNATLSAASLILVTIKGSGKPVGFKAAGGIRTVAAAASYLQIQEEILGKEFVTPEFFRIGASSLVKDVLSVLEIK